MHLLSPRRKKLLIVAGAGSAIEFGMPSVSDVHELFLRTAQQYFPFRNDFKKNIYGYLYDEIERYWIANNRQDQRRKPNFEDVLYAIYTLVGVYPSGINTSALGAFVGMKSFPDTARQDLNDESLLRSLGQQLIDGLLAEMRGRCIQDPPHFAELETFFSFLSQKFDLAVITTNYDDLIHRSLPHLETGFDVGQDSIFDRKRILDRKSWGCLLHLHGSVHFDMDVSNYAVDDMYWQRDFKKCHPNAYGRAVNRTSEGNEYPSSCIIAGYGKPVQIQRQPFRTYYSELDRLTDKCDVVLFLGYGFGDRHLNHAFADYRDARNRPVVVIDYASDTAFSARGSNEFERTSVRRAMSIFRNRSGQMSCNGNDSPPTVGPIKEAKIFEYSTDNGPISFWYNGMLEACRNLPKVMAALGQSI